MRGDEYDAFIDEFVQAVGELFPKCCIQWEDFANFHAVPILERYRDKICTYNDDIQGTAAVALAGILAGAPSAFCRQRLCAVLVVQNCGKLCEPNAHGGVGLADV